MRANVAALNRNIKTIPDNDIQYLGVETLTVGEWSDVETNPRQRDTERHAKRARHLKTWHPDHALVVMAALPDGKRYKIDGHTRAYLWTNDFPPPLGTEIFATVWACPSRAEVMSLYDVHDNQAATESKLEKIFGAMRQYDVQFSSPLLASGNGLITGITLPSELAYGGEHSNINGGFKSWLPELKLLDEVGPTGNKLFPAPMLAAAILILRRHGRNAIPFLYSYAHGQGTKSAGAVDAVEALTRYVEKVRAEKCLHGRTNGMALIGRAFRCYDRHVSGETITNLRGMPAAAVRAWAQKAIKVNRTW